MTMTSTKTTTSFPRITPKGFVWANAGRATLMGMVSAIAASEFHMSLLTPRLQRGVEKAMSTHRSQQELVELLNFVYKFEDWVGFNPDSYSDWLTQPRGLTATETQRASQLASALDAGRMSALSADATLEIFVGLTDADPEIVRATLARQGEIIVTEFGREVLARREAERNQARQAQLERDAEVRRPQLERIEEINQIFSQAGRGDYKSWFLDLMSEKARGSFARLNTLSVKELDTLIRSLRYYEEDLHRSFRNSEARKEQQRLDKEARRAEKSARPTPMPQAPTWMTKHEALKTGPANVQGSGRTPRGVTVGGAGKKDGKSKKGKKG